MAGNEKPHISASLTADEMMGLNSTCSKEHADRITRLASLKQRANKQSDYIFGLVPNLQDLDKAEDLNKLGMRLRNCSSYLVFRDYYTIEQRKLHMKNSCRLFLLCPSCAALRAGKLGKNVEKKVKQVLSERPKLIPAILTLTVKNGSDLSERFNHLMQSFKTLQSRARDYRKKGRGYNEFCKVVGGFYAVELTFNDKAGEWHPHIHIFALLDDYIDHSKLLELWKDITGDSFMVNVKKVHSKSKDKGDNPLLNAVKEVCKYALKFGGLSHDKAWQAYQVLRGKKLSGALGCLIGVKEPDSLTDDMVDACDLPFNELHYSFVYGASSYYNLVYIKNCDAKATLGERIANE